MLVMRESPHYGDISPPALQRVFHMEHSIRIRKPDIGAARGRIEWRVLHVERAIRAHGARSPVLLG